MAKSQYQQQTRRGFTIIEVVLVLAIAGLIFLMVFIALPSLQRSQRDTQRRNDFSRVASQLQSYMSNNNGRLPGTTFGSTTISRQNGITNTAVVGSATNADAANKNTYQNNWINFYYDYMLASGKDTFEDPSGARYNLSIGACSTGTRNAGENCNNGIYALESSATSNTALRLSTSIGLINGSITGTFDETNHTIFIVIGATCNGETAVYGNATDINKAAIVYKLEGAGTYCNAI